jgi:DNA-binding transcriptional MocR family regulator
MLAVASRPGILSLALGLPAAELFPSADFGRAVAQVLASDPRAHCNTGRRHNRLRRTSWN